ncbi:MAG: hypothetical protein E6G19_09660 [Actinobacteria bacterium]|nr:MAG: hypothetical protein E6G19_09660 [Actinomycetota bacterium]
MTGKLIRIGAAVLVATAILATLIVLVPRRQSLFVGIYELVLATIAIGTVVGSFRTFEPEAWMHSPFEREPEKPEQPQPIAELDRIDRLVVLGAANEFDFHYRLRPVLRQVAAERLYGLHAIELDQDPGRARPLLGDELWEAVRPDRKVGRRAGPGLPSAELAAHVARLEQL